LSLITLTIQKNLPDLVLFPLLSSLCICPLGSGRVPSYVHHERIWLKHISAQARKETLEFKIKGPLFQLDPREPQMTPLFQLPPRRTRNNDSYLMTHNLCLISA